MVSSVALAFTWVIGDHPAQRPGDERQIREAEALSVLPRCAEMRTGGVDLGSKGPDRLARHSIEPITVPTS